jgi:hypothetical protein
MESATDSNNAAADWFKNGVFAVFEFSQSETDNVKTNTNAKLTGKRLLCKSSPEAASLSYIRCSRCKSEEHSCQVQDKSKSRFYGHRQWQQLC